MIHVTIYENDRKECIGFQTKGHAEYAEMGQDIVCAAVSVLVINTMNATELYTVDEVQVLPDEVVGIVSFQVNDLPSKEDALIVKTVILCLRQKEDV